MDARSVTLQDAASLRSFLALWCQIVTLIIIASTTASPQYFLLFVCVFVSVFFTQILLFQGAALMNAWWVWSVRVTDGHVQHFRIWIPVKKKSDQKWWIDLKFGCHGYLFKWESINVQCHRVGVRYFALTSCYYIAIHILTTISCLVLLIVNFCQIYWLSGQIFGISKQTLDFCKRWENSASQMKILKKV